MTKNAIFQYMVVNDKVDERGDIGPYKRSDLYNKVADISKRSFEAYANKIGADHIYSDEQVFTKNTDHSTALLYECLRVLYDPMFDRYDNVLFVDTDIVANTDDNIFDLIDGEVAAVLESDIRSYTGGGYNAWDTKPDVYMDYVNKFEAHGAPILPVFPPQFPSKIMILNTGVVVWTKEGRLRARKEFDDWYEWFTTGPQLHMSIMNDQPYISAQLAKHDFDVQFLNQTWNDSPHYPNDNDFFKSNFLHYTGGDWKLLMLEHYESGRYKIFSDN